MTKDQWIELVEWVDERWASRTWTDDQARAYFTDLKGMDASDVWDGIMRLYAEGREYPPTGSVLMSRVRDIYVARIRAEAHQALPAPAAQDASPTWDNWAHQLGYSNMTLDEAIELSHKRQFPKGCNRRGCDVCVVVDA